MMPKGWERKPIKELCESIIDCVNKTAKHVDYITPYKMIRTTNVRHGKVDTENVRYVDEEVYQQWIRRGAPQDGDIIFTREAPVGEAGILENSEGIFLGQRTMMYRVNPKVANNRFVFYSLMSGYCQKQIEDLSNGGTVAHMRVPDCGEIIINSPPLPEQQKIAKILSTWDKAISTTERLIDNSTQQKKALMQQLLTGKKRLLDDEGKRFEGEWEEVKLSKWLIEYKEKSTTQDQYEVYTSSRNGLVLQSDYFANSRIAGRDNIGFHVIPPNHITYRSRSDDGFFTFNLFSSDKNGLISNYYPVFSTKGINEFFIALFEQYRAVFGRYSVGTSQKVLSLNALKDISFKIPSIPEQQKIATVLTNADKEIELLEQQLADLQQEKKALMQVLLTGKKRVVVYGEV